MEVKHEDNRFYVKTAHGDAELLYKITDGNKMSIYHTYVPEKERGKGIAGEIAVAAFEFAKKNKLKVKPDCQYIKHFIEKHPEMKELVFK